MKTDVWLDTTALVDLEFRSAALRQHILGHFPQSSERRTSRYVLFEFARSVLRRYLRLHNKAAELETLSSLTQYISNCNVGSQRTASTMLGAYADYLRFLEKENIALTPAQQLEQFRSWLAPLIRRGWKRALRHATSNPIGCRDNLPAPRSTRPDSKNSAFEQITQELPSKQCGTPDNCRLLHSLQSKAGTFRAMSNALASLPDKDSETSARIPGGATDAARGWNLCGVHRSNRTSASAFADGDRQLCRAASRNGLHGGADHGEGRGVARAG